MPNDFTESTAKIVVAFARKNRLAVADLPSLIGTVNTALAGTTQPEPAPKAAPAISARASVKPDSITCMTCGKKFKSMKRHIRGVHGQTPQQYREQWGLARDYPMAAPNYAAVRSALAKAMGLGAGGRGGKSAALGPQTVAATGKSASQTVTVTGKSATKTVTVAGKSGTKVARPHPKPSARKKG